tara:strand:- start:766 stop:1404 length:639 start_codon:yes stop_codon:yes gene_type:complete
MTEKRVFISHAVADNGLVEAFVNLLTDGIGVPDNVIFCSSVKGFDIPTGSQFIDYIRKQMDGSLFVIMLISPNYLASPFCHAEAGAAWVKATDIFPIVIPPAGFGDLKGVLGDRQAIRIADDVAYNGLREQLSELLEFTPKNSARWDTKRKTYFATLPSLLEVLPTPSMVPVSEIDEIKKQYEESLCEIKSLDEEIIVLKKENRRFEGAQRC